VVIYKKTQHRTIDDLRWFCLARKFSILWQRYTFGCQLKRVRSFYRIQLLRHFFHRWKQTIDNDSDDDHNRARIFYRQRLLKHAFNNWSMLTVQYRQDYAQAMKQLERKRLQMTWHLWKNQSSKRHKRQVQYQSACKQYQRTVLVRVRTSFDD
jgi:hypothetical protein